MKIGILTAGGDCPGLNAAIRGVAKTAIVKHNWQVVGISAGFRGLLTNDYFTITEDKLSGLLTKGGTILGTSREKPFKVTDDDTDKPQIIKENYNKLGLDALVCIGGNGTMKTAYQFSKMGLNIIGMPKTIDNDVWGTDVTFGFDTAVQIATESIDRLHTTANSHNRTMIIEVMGHKAGWIALHAGIAGGGDVILIPELGYDQETVCKYLMERERKNKKYSIVVVAEGLFGKKKKSAAKKLAEIINENTGLETRETILGYIQRGGTPTSNDRILATRYGVGAVELIDKKEFGKMVTMQNGKIKGLDLSEIAYKLKLVTPDSPLVKKARALGTCMGVQL